MSSFQKNCSLIGLLRFQCTSEVETFSTRHFSETGNFSLCDVNGGILVCSIGETEFERKIHQWNEPFAILQLSGFRRKEASAVLKIRVLHQKQNALEQNFETKHQLSVFGELWLAELEELIAVLRQFPTIEKFQIKEKNFSFVCSKIFITWKTVWNFDEKSISCRNGETNVLKLR